MLKNFCKVRLKFSKHAMPSVHLMVSEPIPLLTGDKKAGNEKMRFVLGSHAVDVRRYSFSIHKRRS
jgi:hypothetical protein